MIYWFYCFKKIAIVFNVRFCCVYDNIYTFADKNYWFVIFSNSSFSINHSSSIADFKDTKVSISP